ncbi:Helix-turn-helix domain protein [Mycobacterium marinum]|uniref:helix-turn-helix transcriptional regulator n=1 Tax=Mycobacterium marinum TaxID=1781 RepID=UPI000E28BA84|nr:helix-turn-helix domain-containing protein [Mycobacterium marinum]AXN45606.1 Helix-turn-helix domain protein [Mycobacterium marinum]RFZ01778.1 Helix-turn-helix domain protein [Mycobacterium marinum]
MSERLTLKETSEFLHVPVNTLRWWRTCDEGPRSYSLGRKVFYDQSDLERWVESQKAGTVRGGAR